MTAFPLYLLTLLLKGAFLGVLVSMRETRVRPLGREDPLEEGTATHSSILAGESHGHGVIESDMTEET